MKCPYCKKTIHTGTAEQVEAYDKVYLRGLTLEQAASVIGVTKQAVAKRIQRLRKRYPQLWH